MTKEEALQKIRKLPGVESLTDGWSHKGRTLTIYTGISGTSEPEAFHLLGMAIGEIQHNGSLEDFDVVYLTSVVA